MSNHEEVHHNPREALDAFIHRLEADSERSKTSARHCYYLWRSLYVISLVAGFLTSVLAALLKDDYFVGFTWGRIVLIILPFVGSFASTILVQAKVQNLWKLREDGKRAIEDLVEEGRRRFSAAVSAQPPEGRLAECSRIYEDLQNKRNKLKEIESKSLFELFRQDIITKNP